MRKDLIIVFGIMLWLVGMFLLGSFGVSPNLLRGATSVVVLPIVVFLARRFRRSAPEVPWACHVAATFAVTLGALALIGGIGHSAAVASLALREDAFGPLQALRFTTGAMLVYAGVMNLAIHRALKAGRRWAIGVGAGAALLFCVYLVFQLALPGSSGSSAPVSLVMWSVYLLCLGAAALESKPGGGSPQQVMPALSAG